MAFSSKSREINNSSSIQLSPRLTVPTSNNTPSWSKDRTLHADNPVFHFSFSSGFRRPLFFFSFPNYTRTHLAKPPTSISCLFSCNPPCISISLLSLSLYYLSMWCACVVIYVACSWYTPPSQKSFPFSFLFSRLSIQIYCSSSCTDRQTDSIFLAPPFWSLFLTGFLLLHTHSYVFA